MSFEFIKTRLVLVEHNQKAKPGELFINGMHKLCKYAGSNDENKFYNAQHIYLINKDKINPGDWYLMNFDVSDPYNPWELMHCRDKEEANRCNNNLTIAPNCFKIIATNNTEIKIGCTCNPGINWWHHSEPTNCEFEVEDNYNRAWKCGKKEVAVPQIPEQFVENYMKNVNAGNYFKDIYLETVPDYSDLPDDEDEIIGCWRAYVNYVLKVDENNFVSVRPIRENYSRDEVKTLLKAFHLDSVEGKYTKDLLEWCNEWIGENLY